MLPNNHIVDKPNEKRSIDRFVEILKIPGASMDEQGVAAYLEKQLKKMGFITQFDEANKEIGGNCGNLIAYWEGTDPTVPSLFFSGHMDTIFSTENLNIVIRDGNIYSDGTTILGCDDRGALSSYLEGIQIIQENNIPCGPVELLFTISEQRGLLGAHNIDNSKIRSKFGYVFDHPGDYGKQIVNRGGYSYSISFELHGPNPQNGHFTINKTAVNAFLIAADFLKSLKLGIIDEDTLANIGIIKGGEITSITPSSVKIYGEVRSLTAKGLYKQLNHMKEAANRAAESYGGHAQVTIEKRYDGFDETSDSPIVRNAIMASEALDLEWYLDSSVGGADSNALQEKGLVVLTMGSGFKEIHTHQEHVSIENVVNGGRYISALIQSWYNMHKDNVIV